jgi:hypothetical protein
MVIDRPTHETIIAVEDCKYLAAIEALYGSEDHDTVRYIRFGTVGFEESVCMYPDEFNGFRHLLDEVESYLNQQKSA